MIEVSIGQKIDLLKRSNLFANLKQFELSILADYSETRECYRGETIFTQGTQSSQCFILIHGEVMIIREGDGSRQMDVARFITGDSFGELDLLGNAIHSATAICIKESALLVFPVRGLTLEKFLNMHPYIAAHIMHKLLGLIANRIRQTNELISEKTPWIHELRRQLHTDKLTGLYSKMFLDDELENVLQNAEKETYFLLIKPDNFKDINDNYGHEAGDRVLRLMAILLYSVLREHDYGIRYRGDEFAALLPNADINEAVRVSDEIRQAIRGMDLEEISAENEITVSLSIGLSHFPGQCTSAQSMIERAYENAMKARKSGGDCSAYG
ncbi:MAG TPA: GGDEF domain-containing protein [Spirochaetota bacterium]|nr:GGDEF domain-containing protein [Spirochaetota bacterium]HRZ25864.1 GGDEF domain-containing protein [Spirochaetota bacterium]HSA13795.1 GGDEF domain-containing protein [Spirochaetota bacterium]